MLKIIITILIFSSSLFASFDLVSTALENYIQSSYELSAKDKKDPKLLRALKEEKATSIEQLLIALKEPLDKEDIKKYLAHLNNNSAKRLYEGFYDFLFSFHLYLNKKDALTSKEVQNTAKSLDEELKSFILNSSDESYKGFLLKTRALFLKDILSRLQKDLIRSDAYFLNSLNLQGLINVINKNLAFGFLNTGKILLCILVLLIFYFLMKALTKLSYYLVFKYLHFFNKNQSLEDRHFKETFLHKLQRPIQYFIIVYSIGICIAISFYPASINLGLYRLLNLAYLWIIVWFIINLLDSYGLMLISKLAIKSGQKEIINLVIKMLYSLIAIIAVLISLQMFGFNISTIIASLGIGGLAIALASKDIISNFFASIMLLFDDSFEQGDWVKIGSVEGTIVETGLRKTSIRGFDNTLAFIPNATIMSASIVNFSRRKLGRRVNLSLGLTYGSDPQKIKALSAAILEYLKSSPYVAQSQDKQYLTSTAKYRQSLVNLDTLEGYSSTIFVGLASFGDFSINIDLSFYTKQVDGVGHRQDKEQILLKLLYMVKEHGLSLAFPTQSIYIEKNEEDKNSI